MSYNKLCYVYVISNEPTKVADLQTLANQLISMKARKTLVV